MKQRITFLFSVLVFVSVLLSFAPSSAHAQMDCLFCHDLHNAAGGTLNTAAEFDLICDTCHGPSGTAIFADRHVDPTVNESSGNTGPALWEMGCQTCHTPHRTDTVNHLYNDGAAHQHLLDSDNQVTDHFGLNIKLLGRNEDGTGVAKFATPLRIISVSATGPCTNSNTEVEVFLPPSSAGEGPPATIMVGDRITINNSNAEFDGTFRVKETNWDGFSNAPPTGWVCFDRPTAATYSGNGFVRSMGWHSRPTIRTAAWVPGTATLSLNDGYSIRVGDMIEVSGVTEDPPGTFNGLHTVNAVTNTAITAASWSVDTATVTLAENHLYQVGERIVVSDVISSGPGVFNGEFVVAGVGVSSVSYALATDPGTFTNNGNIATPVRSRVAYDATSDPGAFSVTGARVEYAGSIKSAQSMAVFQPPPLPGEEPYSVLGLTFTSGKRANQADTVVLTVERPHDFQVNGTFTATGIISVGGTTDEFNGTWTVTGIPNPDEIEFQKIWDPDPGAYVSGGVIPHPNTPPPVLEITLTNSDTDINQFKPASGVPDGDIITVFDADPAEYNGRWEVESVALPVITVRCPPYFSTSNSKPGCPQLGTFGAYVGGGEIQSTGSMRPVVFESRGTDNNDVNFLSDYTHSFTNTDEDLDGWMDGPCEICHTQTANHKNDDFGNTHNNGRTCTASCHTHSTGFDKANAFCPVGRTCPPVN